MQQRPSHRPTSRRLELIQSAVALDIQRCGLVDSDPDLASEMWEAYRYIVGAAKGMTDYQAEPDRKCECRPNGDMCYACVVRAAELADFEDL